MMEIIEASINFKKYSFDYQILSGNPAIVNSRFQKSEVRLQQQVCAL